MQLSFNPTLAAGYRSKSQIIRVLSEAWVQQNAYCPHCANDSLTAFSNNQPVADFYCHICQEQYELKSKQTKLGNIITDGAYSTMMARIDSDHNPNFFFLTYSKQLTINNFLIIPKHFFTPAVIIKRPPLPITAKRAGWVGCNIDLRHIPESGKVFLIKNQTVIERKTVTEQYAKTLFLRTQSQDSRGWLLDVLNVVDTLPNTFVLAQVYEFSDKLAQLHPDNNTIHAKIRQQLQLLRDKGFIEFLGKGRYRKTV